MQNENEQLNSNESLQKQGLYMIKDKTTGLHSLLYQSFSEDRTACQEIINYLGYTFKSLKKAQKQKFLQSMHNSVIVKVGYIDILTGSLVPEYNFLIDLRDIEVSKEEKKEKEEKE